MILTIAVLAVIGLLIVVVLIAANEIFDVAINAKKTKEKVLKTNANKNEDNTPKEKPEKARANAWLREQPLERQEILSFDGLTLAAHILPADTPTHLWAICVHGFSGNGLNLGIAAQHWHEKGWNVLLPDLRGCGESEGNYYGMGWLDRLDILEWIQKVVLKQVPEAQIVLHGVSMGAAAVMMTTGEKLPKNVRAAVEDCGYTDVWEEFTLQLKKVFGLPQFPIMHIANGMAKSRAGYSFKEASSVEQVKKSETPTLFIHGDADTFVPFFMLDKVYDAAACVKKKMVVHGAQHGEAAQLEPQRYWDTVHTFVEKYLD